MERRLAVWRPVLWSFGAAAIAGLGVRALAPADHLSAAQRAGGAPTAWLDSDGDGLTDVLEVVHGLDPHAIDTDGDGFTDAVELALGSNPKDATSRPGQVDYSVGLVPYENEGNFHLTQFVYAPGGNVVGLNYGVFLYVQGQVVALPPELLTANATLSVLSGGAGTDAVFVLNSTIPAPLLKQVGPLSLIAATTLAGTGKWSSVAGATIVPVDGVLHQILTTSQAGVPELGNGSIYVPLLPQDQLPGTFQPGQICVQITEPVGVVGPMVVHQVQFSECAAADGYCAGAGCGGQAGTTYELLDPLLLIGG